MPIPYRIHICILIPTCPTTSPSHCHQSHILCFFRLSFEVMIGLKSTLNVIDNSGALLIECVNVLKQKVNNGWGSVGDEIVCVVKRARPVSAATQASTTAVKVRRGDVRRAVIVRTKKSVRRPDGRFIRFDDNAAVLLNNKREMLGTRIGGVVSADLRMKGWGKIVSLAPKVV
ncbi:ribosomal protein L14p/L23e-domain-containing protein [Suillus variegatus]|nr:ribosomal protein L14p/L23e-domain-containing protein [Suillus variegatus]